MIKLIAIVLCMVLLILSLVAHLKRNNILLKISIYYFFVGSLIWLFVVNEFEKQKLMPIIICFLLILILYLVLLVFVNQLTEKQRAIFELRQVSHKNRIGVTVFRLVILGEILLLCMIFILEMLSNINLESLFTVEKVVSVIFIITVVAYVQIYYNKRNQS